MSGPSGGAEPDLERRCTLLVVYAEQEEPWIILTDLAPDKVGPSWYALRRIELGFKAIKSLGWKWDKTRRTDPARVSRHWLVLFALWRPGPWPSETPGGLRTWRAGVWRLG